MRFLVTKHAVRRYRARIDDCPPAEAIDRLQHAVEISRHLSPWQLRMVTSRGNSRRQRQYGRDVMRFCHVEDLVLIFRRARDDQELLVLVTVFRLKA